MWYVMLGSLEEGHTLMSTRLGTRYASISFGRDAERANDDHDEDDEMLRMIFFTDSVSGGHR